MTDKALLKIIAAQLERWAKVKSANQQLEQKRLAREIHNHLSKSSLKPKLKNSDREY